MRSESPPVLRSTRQLHGYRIAASNGLIGSIDDFYFDDQQWTIRYLVVDTGKWLPGRRVLLSPAVLGQPNWSEQLIDTPLTREQVKDSPDIHAHKPVSRQHELAYLRYYSVPPYWTGPELWGTAAFPMRVTPMDYAAVDRAIDTERARAEAQGDTQLRSTREVSGYRIDANDGELGKVEDFLFDDETWATRYLVVNTARWWFGHRVLIAPAWTRSVNWAEQTVSVDVGREQVKHAPRYDSAEHIDRQWEADYYRHYGVAPYWDRSTSLPPP
jgi:hypothetical protein